MNRPLLALFAVLFLGWSSSTFAKDEMGGPCICRCLNGKTNLYQTSSESSDFFTKEFEAGLKSVAACSGLTGKQCSGRKDPLDGSSVAGVYAACQVPELLQQSMN